MDNSVIYKENLRFRSGWLWVLLISIDVLILFLLVRSMVDKGLSNEHSNEPLGMLIAFIILFWVNLLIASIRLSIKISEEGLYYRYFPFHSGWRVIPWKSVAKVYVRTYNPIIEYGGWGIRWGIMGAGKAYTTGGTYGIQIHFINHQKVLLGTYRPKEAELALKSLHLGKGKTVVEGSIKKNDIFGFMKVILYSILFFSFTAAGFSQSRNRGCRTMEAFAGRVAQRLSDESVLHNLKKPILLTTTLMSNDTFVIPVVVHVVYKLSSENISDAQIHSQIRILNEDFLRKINTNGSNTHPSGSNTNIRFELARQDPYGNPTTGITRTQTNRSEFSDNDYVKMSNYGGKDPWPANFYLNLWVCNLQTFYLGYSSFPGDNPVRDGVVIDYKAFGDIGTASVPYNLGRTTTHELGHWLGLFHIWGDDDGSANNCWGSDYIDDTPNQALPTMDCPTSIEISCNNGPDGNMYQNYMDYTEDACLNIFTKGQAQKMNYILANYRNELKNSVGLGGVGIQTCLNTLTLSMHPNPTEGIIYLDESFVNNAVLQVYNTLGVLVYKESLSSTRIDLNGLDAGIYYVYLTQKDQYIWTNKLVVQ